MLSKHTMCLHTAIVHIVCVCGGGGRANFLIEALHRYTEVLRADGALANCVFVCVCVLNGTSCINT